MLPLLAAYEDEARNDDCNSGGSCGSDGALVAAVPVLSAALVAVVEVAAEDTPDCVKPLS